MTDNNMKKRLDEALEGLELTDQLKERITEKVQSGSRHYRPKRTFFAALCAVVALTAMAAAASLHKIVTDYLSGTFEEKVITEVQMEPGAKENTTGQGIAFHVTSAITDGYNTVLYAVIQDLEGDRLDETLQTDSNLRDFNSSYSHSSLNGVSYDPASKSIIARMEIESFDMDTQPLHLETNMIRSKEKRYNGLLLSKDIGQELVNADDFIFVDNGVRQLKASVIDTGSNPEEDYEVVLTPLLPYFEEEPAPAETDAISFAGAGFINDEFHIRVKCNGQYPYQFKTNTSLSPNILEDKSYMTEIIYYTFDENMEPVLLSYTNSKAETSFYREQIFYNEDVDLSPEKLKGVSLMADMTVWDTCIDGQWSASFTIAPVQNKIVKDCQIDMPEGTFTTIAASPIGITFLGVFEESPEDKFNITAYIDGEIKELSFSLEWSRADLSDQKENCIARCSFEEITDITKVEWISINGTKIYLQDE